MVSKGSFKKDFGVEVSTLNNGHRHYFLAENSRKNLDLFKFFDAIYSDIGWHLDRVIPEVIIPVVHDKNTADGKFYIYDLESDADLCDRHSIRQMISKDAVTMLAEKLERTSLEFYYDCDNYKELDQRIRKCNKLTFYHYGRIVFEADRDKAHSTWTPTYLYADSNVLAGMQPIIKCMV